MIDMRSDAKCTSWSSLGALKVIGNVTIQYSAYDFLVDCNRNCASILYRVRDIASYLSKVADFNPPHLHLAPPQYMLWPCVCVCHKSVFY